MFVARTKSEDVYGVTCHLYYYYVANICANPSKFDTQNVKDEQQYFGEIHYIEKNKICVNVAWK